jgi:hypothetical protein
VPNAINGCAPSTSRRFFVSEEACELSLEQGKEIVMRDAPAHVTAEGICVNVGEGA